MVVSFPGQPHPECHQPHPKIFSRCTMCSQLSCRRRRACCGQPSYYFPVRTPPVSSASVSPIVTPSVSPTASDASVSETKTASSAPSLVEASSSAASVCEVSNIERYGLSGYSLQAREASAYEGEDTQLIRTCG